MSQLLWNDPGDFVKRQINVHTTQYYDCKLHNYYTRLIIKLSIGLFVEIKGAHLLIKCYGVDSKNSIFFEDK